MLIRHILSRLRTELKLPIMGIKCGVRVTYHSPNGAIFTSLKTSVEKYSTRNRLTCILLKLGLISFICIYYYRKVKTS